MRFPQTRSKEETTSNRGLKLSPCSTADPELIRISVNLAAGAGELRGNSSHSVTR